MTMRIKLFSVLALLASGVAFSSLVNDAPGANARIEKDLGALYCDTEVARVEALGCGETVCRTNADCPSNCGPCITWSGTCALFQPRTE